MKPGKLEETMPDSILPGRGSKRKYANTKQFLGGGWFHLGLMLAFKDGGHQLMME